MTARVHPSSVVAREAWLDDDVEIGPFCQVGPGVHVQGGTVLLGHVALFGPLTLGRDNRIHPFAVLGADPQDKSHSGAETRLEIGDRNVFREQATAHRGTEKGDGVTRIGSDNWLLVGAHVAHDCQVGSSVVLTNLATLGGHVVVEDNVVCGGHVTVAPFVRLGRGAFIAGGARVETDVPPFVIAQGDRARVRSLNSVGLGRLGVPAPSQVALRAAFKGLFLGSVPRSQALVSVRQQWGHDPWVGELCAFMERRLPSLDR